MKTQYQELIDQSNRWWAELRESALSLLDDLHPSVRERVEREMDGIDRSLILSRIKALDEVLGQLDTSDPRLDPAREVVQAEKDRLIAELDCLGDPE